MNNAFGDFNWAAPPGGGGAVHTQAPHNLVADHCVT